jgi:hypothetical protein
MQPEGGVSGEFVPFDWSLYGVLIRNDRRAMGFERVQDFSASLWRRTHYKVTQETLYKVEQGRQVPGTMQFMAINIALYGEPLPSRVVEACMSPEWRRIAAAKGDIPAEWKRQNFRDAAGDRAADPALTPQELGRQTGDAAGLFENPNVPGV